MDRALRLSEQGLIDREVAQITGVSIGAVQKWRTGQRRTPAKERKHANCPRCGGAPLDELAYAYLFGLYLGDGHITRHRRGAFALSIFCCDAWPDLITAAKSAMHEVMPASSVCSVQRTGMTEIKSYSKHWPCLLPQHGPGMKHSRKIELAEWQQVIVDRYPGDFVRGLIHSDGCRSMNRVRRVLADGEHWYEYPRYFFSNKSLDILGLCGAALYRLGVEWRFVRWDVISVAKKGPWRGWMSSSGPSTEQGEGHQPGAGSRDGQPGGRSSPVCSVSSPLVRRRVAWPIVMRSPSCRSLGSCWPIRVPLT